MRRLSTVFAFIAVSASLAAQAPAPAATRPDFAGTWNLDPKNSAGVGVPKAMTLRIANDAKVMTFARVATMPTGGEQRSTLMVKLDGSPTKNTIGTQGLTFDLDLAASWDGPTLVVKTTAQIGGQPLEQTDRWSVSPDGKTLHLDTSVTAPQAATAKLTFTKQ
jgi:hypothetical protein